MTLQEWMTNPLGKGEASLPGKDNVVAGLSDAYRRIVKTRGDYILKTNYFDSVKKDYYIHLVIPSDSEKRNTYDVVFRFINPKDGSNRNVKNWETQFFCNTIGFAFTFAYVYKRNGMLVPVLEQKFSRKMLNTAPVVRNRYGIPNYEKYLFIAAKYILDREMTSLDVSALEKSSKRFNGAVLNRNVRSVAKIMDETNDEKDRLRSLKKISKAQEKENNSRVATVKKPMHGTGRVEPKMSTFGKRIGEASSNRHMVKRAPKAPKRMRPKRK